MLDLVLLGIGAAGNKAAITAIEQGAISESDVRLINTTTKDIPENYKKDPNKVIKFSSMLGGCGKEPVKGQRAMFQAIKEQKIDLYKMLNQNTKAVVLVTSIEGGTGCGATPVVAKFFAAMNIPVHVFAFVGFQDELRGTNNSLKFFKELPDSIILHTIDNNKFLDSTRSYSKAEASANIEFAKQLQILSGSKMIDSTQNIDDTDLYKITTTTGYMDIHHIDITNAKNVELTNKAIAEAFESITCLGYDSKCTRFAVIVNKPKREEEDEKERKNKGLPSDIDDEYKVIKQYAGEPIESFRHDQFNGEDRYIDIIVSGLPYPEEGIKNIGKKYTELKNRVNTSTKSLSDIFSDMDIDDIEETNIPRIINPSEVLANFTLGNDTPMLKPNMNIGKPAKRADVDDLEDFE